MFPIGKKTLKKTLEENSLLRKNIQKTHRFPWKKVKGYENFAIVEKCVVLLIEIPGNHQMILPHPTLLVRKPPPKVQPRREERDWEYLHSYPRRKTPSKNEQCVTVAFWRAWIRFFSSCHYHKWAELDGTRFILFIPVQMPEVTVLECFWDELNGTGDFSWCTHGGLMKIDEKKNPRKRCIFAKVPSTLWWSLQTLWDLEGKGAKFIH